MLGASMLMGTITSSYGDPFIIIIIWYSLLSFVIIPYGFTVEVTSRFKGLDLVDRVPEELWMKVYNTIQEIVTHTIPKKKKFKKAKWLSEKAL